MNGKNSVSIFQDFLEDEKELPQAGYRMSGEKEEENEEYQSEDYTSLSNEEKREKIRKLKIENESKLRTLVEKDLVTSILGEIGQSIQNNIIDQAKRKSNVWAALLGIPEKEREIEKLLSDLGEEEVNGLIGDIERLSNDGVWE